MYSTPKSYYVLRYIRSREAHASVSSTARLRLYTRHVAEEKALSILPVMPFNLEPHATCQPSSAFASRRPGPHVSICPGHEKRKPTLQTG